MSKVLTFSYLNHRGEKSFRNVVPENIWFGTSKYHAKEQWFMRAFCKDRQDWRDFALGDIHKIIAK